MAFSRAEVVSGVAFSTFVFGVLVMTIVSLLSDKIASSSLDVDGRMASFIEHILGSVRVVHSYNIAPELMRRLRDLYMVPVSKFALLRSATKGLETGVLYFIIGAMYALTFWRSRLDTARNRSPM